MLPIPLLKSSPLFLVLARSSLGWVAVVTSTKGLRWVTLQATRTGAAVAARERFGGGLEVLSAQARSKKEGALALKILSWANIVLRCVENPAQHEPCPLDIEGTAFQRSVWAMLQKIPAGSVVSYVDVARQVGRPRAARAVGNACGANPIAFLIPCHRVVASDGRLGGFGLGVEIKTALLAREGVRI
jgi:AraC family transcriptional regulator of adaptative response/methylated-DNA-[protein]-cysteine methyltransferase